ncbi:hypothetical protein Droror1_Dr00005985 [Drosera rotundifolia]
MSQDGSPQVETQDVTPPELRCSGRISRKPGRSAAAKKRGENLASLPSSRTASSSASSVSPPSSLEDLLSPAVAKEQEYPQFSPPKCAAIDWKRRARGRSSRTEVFQARCLMKLMNVHGVEKISLVGINYDGFVGYSMAAQFFEAVEKAMLCCTGVCLEERDMAEGLFRVTNLEEAERILLPHT